MAGGEGPGCKECQDGMKRGCCRWHGDGRRMDLASEGQEWARGRSARLGVQQHPAERRLGEWRC